MTSIVERLRNPFIQQYLIEIVFPLLGYFFFGWDILIIGIYYFVDQLCSQIMFYRRALWVKNKGSIEGFGTLFFILFVPAFLVIFFFEIVWFDYLIAQTQEMNANQIWEAVLAFGKSELWLLFPVVLLVYHLRDQFTFYMPRRFMNYNFQQMMSYNFLSNMIILILFVLLGVLWMKFTLPNILVISLFLVLKISYDLTLKKIFLNKSIYRGKKWDTN